MHDSSAQHFTDPEKEVYDFVSDGLLHFLSKLARAAEVQLHNSEARWKKKDETQNSQQKLLSRQKSRKWIASGDQRNNHRPPRLKKVSLKTIKRHKKNLEQKNMWWTISNNWDQLCSIDVYIYTQEYTCIYYIHIIMNAVCIVFCQRCSLNLRVSLGLENPDCTKHRWSQWWLVNLHKEHKLPVTACHGVSRRVTATPSRHPGPTKGSHALIESKHSALQSQLSIYVYIYV